ncbi:MAG: hypothetical protein KJ804_17495 [Proteobacteria bacterium]|nr:hypothetical protein [Pseudomonadota bacterium]MBU1060102.1 hypothetical protein [Pseudomonadota bacterium]
MEVIMSGYDNLIWVFDKEGKEYVCELDSMRKNFKDGDELSSEERKHCRNVNEIVGTERW